jgi:subtilase family serine protease
MRASRTTAREMISTARDQRRAAKLRLETLEPRAMLPASPSPADLICHPNLRSFTGAGPSGGFTPAQILHAYGFDQVTWRGAGETIAIVDACDDPTVAADLHAFDQQFGLTDPKLTVTKLTMNGQSPAYDSLWAMEISLDIEWAHAIAPKANILLVESPTASLGALLNAVDYARYQPGVGVVSMSWGSSEFSMEGYYDSHFTTPAGHGNVTFVASSGDSGAPSSWPSISTNVLAVGGTTLSVGTNNAYAGETAWSRSGGGYSPYETEPTYQHGVQTSGFRSNPDVAYDADPASGFSIYDNGAWYCVGGTSAGAPQWAGLIARVNQARVANGRARLNTALPAIYSLPKADFHDITVGNNGYAAGVGYDAATGRGSPIAQFVIRDLIAYKQPASVPAHAVATTLTSQSSPTVGQSIATGGDITGDGFAQFVQVGGGATTILGSPAESASAQLSRGAESIATTATASNWSTDGRVVTAFVGSSRSTESSNAGAQLSAFAQADQAAATTESAARDVFETSVSFTVSSPRGSSHSEHLLDGDLNFGGAGGDAADSSLQRDLIDACLSDPQGLTLREADIKLRAADVTHFNPQSALPLAAAGLCLVIEADRSRKTGSHLPTQSRNGR